MATPASAPAGDQKSQLQALRKIDALSEKLQKEVKRYFFAAHRSHRFAAALQGKLLEALQCMEKSLILRGHVFGLDSVEVYRACKSVGEMCNYLAMTYLQQGASVSGERVLYSGMRARRRIRHHAGAAQESRGAHRTTPRGARCHVQQPGLLLPQVCLFGACSCACSSAATAGAASCARLSAT